MADGTLFVVPIMNDSGGWKLPFVFVENGKAFLLRKEEIADGNDMVPIFTLNWEDLVGEKRKRSSSDHHRVEIPLALLECGKKDSSIVELKQPSDYSVISKDSAEVELKIHLKSVGTKLPKAMELKSVVHSAQLHDQIQRSVGAVLAERPFFVEPVEPNKIYSSKDMNIIDDLFYTMPASLTDEHIHSLQDLMEVRLRKGNVGPNHVLPSADALHDCQQILGREIGSLSCVDPHAIGEEEVNRLSRITSLLYRSPPQVSQVNFVNVLDVVKRRADRKLREIVSPTVVMMSFS